MRIVLLYNYVPTHLGGVEVVVDSLATEWARRGHDVVAIGSEVPHVAIRPRSNAYQVIGIPAGNWVEDRFGVPYPIPSPALLPTLMREIARADVVHGHGFLCLPTLAAFSVARALGRRSPVRLLTEHVGHVTYPSRVIDTVEKLAIGSFGRASAKLAEGIVVFNTRVAEELHAIAPRAMQRWISNGVDGSIYSPVPADEKERLRSELGWDHVPRVLFVGRLVPKKGADIAAAAAGLAGGAFKLVMIGPGSLPDPKSEHIELMGTLPYDRVASLYRAADAFLLPSYGEGFPLTAQEALASGLPVFLGQDDAYAPYISGAGEGVHLLARDSSTVASELVRFLSDPVRREQARTDALAHAQRSFSWVRAVDEHERFIDELKQRR